MYMDIISISKILSNYCYPNSDTRTCYRSNRMMGEIESWKTKKKKKTSLVISTEHYVADVLLFKLRKTVSHLPVNAQIQLMVVENFISKLYVEWNLLCFQLLAVLVPTLKWTAILVTSPPLSTLTVMLIEGNGYETLQSSLLYVFVAFLALTVHKAQ